MRARALVAVAAVLVLSACGGGDDGGSASTAASPTASASPAKKHAGPALPGTSANADLSDFVCEGDSDGEWTARGVLSSPRGRADYQVKVAVAPDGTRHSKARSKIIADVTKNNPTSFRVKHIPGDGAGGTCRVQVVRLD